LRLQTRYVVFTTLYNLFPNFYCRAGLSSNPTVHSHLAVLYDTLLQQNLLHIVESYSVIEIDYVANQAPKINYKIFPGSLSNFWELQQVMWTTHAGLTNRRMYDSRPSTWPRLTRGMVSLIVVIEVYV